MYLLLLTSTVAAVNSAALDVDAIRIGLHLLTMAVWVGGQIIMVALLPVLRSAAATSPSLRGASAGIGFLASLVVVVLGAMMAH